MHADMLWRPNLESYHRNQSSKSKIAHRRTNSRTSIGSRKRADLSCGCTSIVAPPSFVLVGIMQWVVQRQEAVRGELNGLNNMLEANDRTRVMKCFVGHVQKLIDFHVKHGRLPRFE
jgi:hypothetical protein